MSMEILYDFSVSLFGAFFGFLFALLSEAIISNRARQKDIKIYLTNIRDELSEIRHALNNNKNNVETKLLFDFPLLEAFIASGEIRYIIKNTYYKHLIRINTKMKIANDLEEVHERKELALAKRKEILQLLDELLSDTNFLKDTSVD